ncbi:hypothetical protein [Methanosarcina sp.]|uniref:hypothetical protein n=1 Tax=Methanosarcina sp. TaxID=2213 RepID=UPI002ABAF88B|nr:hypothetical protein [Methanosarcina sp.]MDY9927378.1 hypothetical protein [Methanosarcina sp.]
MKKNTYLILFISVILLLLIVSMVSGYINSQLSDEITNDVMSSGLKDSNSSKKIGYISEIRLDKVIGKLSVTEGLVYMDDDPLGVSKSGHILEYDAMLAAIEIMRVAEKYPKIKTVIIEIRSNDPSMPNMVHLETRTGQGIDWTTEIPTTEDLQGYSKQKFDTANWFVNIVK